MSRLPYKLFSSWQFLRQGGARILTYKHVRLVSSLWLSYKFLGNSRFRRKSNDFRLWVKRHKVEIFKWILVYLILLGALVTQVKLIHLNSESVPYHFCLQFYNVQPKKGDLCVFNFKNLTFVKYLLGEAGDTVLKKGNFVYVNSKFVGKIKKVGGLSPVESTVIPKGYVFVAGTHADSLDSRYKEFGLIKRSDIKGMAVGCLRR